MPSTQTRSVRRPAAIQLVEQVNGPRSGGRGAVPQSPRQTRTRALRCRTARGRALIPHPAESHEVGILQVRRVPQTERVADLVQGDQLDVLRLYESTPKGRGRSDRTRMFGQFCVPQTAKPPNTAPPAVGTKWTTMSAARCGFLDVPVTSVSVISPSKHRFSTSLHVAMASVTASI